MKRILVTSAGSESGRSFIAALRLGDEPVHVVGADSNAFQLACADVDASYLLPPASDPGWKERLLDVVARERVTWVHAQSDIDAARLSECRKDLPGLTLLPEHADIVAAQNRMHTNRLLLAADVPAPVVVRVHERLAMEGALDEVADRNGRAWIRPVRTGTAYPTVAVATAAQADAWIRYGVESSGASPTDFVLYTNLPGREYLFQGLWLDGALLTSAVMERMDLPQGGTVSNGPVVARSVHRGDVTDVSTRAVRALSPRPTGPYAVVLKEDEGGIPRVTDVTAARFRTLVHFAAAAGMPIVQACVRMAYGMPLPGLVRTDALEEDLYWVRGMDRKPHLFKGAPWVHRRAA